MYDIAISINNESNLQQLQTNKKDVIKHFLISASLL